MRESEICDNFIEYAKNFNFQNFNEYEGWDFILVRGNCIVGVQAKVDLNWDVVRQATELDNVHFKVILYNNTVENKEMSKNFTVISKKLKLIRIQQIDNQFQFVDIKSWKHFFLVRHRPKQLLIIPDFKYDNPAGVPAPRKVTDNNIRLVKLDIFCDKQGGWLTTNQFKQFGFTRIPKYYYHFNFLDKKWYKDPNHNASLDYKHITKGLLGHV